MYKIITLDNGLRIALDKISTVRSTAIGIWTLSGSAHEPNELRGISHFIEHLNFKGTKDKSAKDIAVLFDEMGGSCNAFTSKEMTCFYAKVLDTKTHIALGMLCDMFLHSSYKKVDIESEKKVIYEEISMCEDTPEDLVVELLAKGVWKDNSIADKIVGSKKTISSFDTKTIKDYIKQKISAKNTVVTISGNFIEKDIIAQVTSEFKNMNTNDVSIYLPHADFKICNILKSKDIEQSHIVLGFEGYDSSKEKQYYALSVLNTAFGNGMSSRLFQRIREDEGLAYSIYSFPVRYNAAGIFAIYMAVNPKNIEKATNAVIEEIKLLKEHSLSSKEILRAKEQLKAGLIMGLENTSSRMMSMGKSVLMYNKIKTPNQLIKLVDNVTPKDIKNVIDEIFNLEKMAKSIVTAK